MCVTVIKNRHLTLSFSGGGIVFVSVYLFRFFFEKLNKITLEKGYNIDDFLTISSTKQTHTHGANLDSPLDVDQPHPTQLFQQQASPRDVVSGKLALQGKSKFKIAEDY